VQVGDLVVYDPDAVGRMTGGKWQDISSEDYGLGVVLDENPYYYFVNWSNVVGSMFAIPKDHVLPATIENVQRLREHDDCKKSS
jgi:hypothetical protein